MKKERYIFFLLCLLAVTRAAGQGIHFSQYYNSPLLQNPANTALMPDNDFRLGLNYRNQWAAVPVPYNTFSAFGDFKVGGNSDNENHNNWLGLGIAFFNDKAGDGNLSLSQIQGDIAYHLQTSRHFMISLGISAAAVGRSVNYDNLSFDAQWDGRNFNRDMANGEQVGVIKTSYYTVAPGINFSWFPNESLYVKLGGSVANINQPVESFYHNGNNTIGYRPIANLDVAIQGSPSVIINPSAYYTTLMGATELVGGVLVRTMLSDKNQTPAQLILELHMRLGDAVIGAAGIQLGAIQFMFNYDFTVSQLSPYNASYGALEFSLIYQGKYNKNKGNRKAYNCPRFF